MKVMIITGSFPPIRCGVGDYTFQLAQFLSECPGVEVGVLTSSIADSNSLPKVAIFNEVYSWALWCLPKNLRTIRNFSPDVIHIQYPTQGCAAPMFLPLLLRMFGHRVVQTWHEHYSECSAIGLPNLFASRAIVHVRRDLPTKLPRWLNCLFHVFKQRLVHIPNASTIPVATLSESQVASVKKEFTADKLLVCFFGFAYPNKGLERLFEIADPTKHHLVLVCDLDENNTYQSQIRSIVESPRWKAFTTVTGFLPAVRVAEILAVADCVMFPFPGGTGDWNTSLLAAERAGAFSIATSNDSQFFGYQKDRNVAFTSCDDLEGMRRLLLLHAGTRKLARQVDDWKYIAEMHAQTYQDCF